MVIVEGLRISINEPSHIWFATLWITACITLHNFAMCHEAGSDLSTDEFFISGQAVLEEERVAARVRAEQEEIRAGRDEAL